MRAVSIATEALLVDVGSLEFVSVSSHCNIRMSSEICFVHWLCGVVALWSGALGASDIVMKRLITQSNHITRIFVCG